MYKLFLYISLELFISSINTFYCNNFKKKSYVTERLHESCSMHAMERKHFLSVTSLYFLFKNVKGKTWENNISLRIDNETMQLKVI